MTALVGYLLLFVVVGVGFILVHLLIGKLIRPAKPSAEKLTVYECGEPTIGSAWIQFDLRFYVIALLFVIFDVEVAFFFPWAVVFGQTNTLANSPPQQQVRQRAEAFLNLATTDPQDQVKAQQIRELLQQDTPEALKEIDQELGGPVAERAHTFAWLAFGDIFVFFGVILVGFAYLWRRGDLAWVRSTAAERFTPQTEPEPAQAPAPERVLVGAGQGP